MSGKPYEEMTPYEQLLQNHNRVNAKYRVLYEAVEEAASGLRSNTLDAVAASDLLYKSFDRVNRMPHAGQG